MSATLLKLFEVSTSLCSVPTTGQVDSRRPVVQRWERDGNE